MEPELEKNQRSLRKVLDTLPVGVLVLDREGNVSLSNGAAASIWGRVVVPGDERWQRSTGTWHATGKPVTEWASQRALERGETSLNELIDIRTYGGDRRTIQNSSAPILDADGSVIGAVVVNEDVTERVDAQTELERRLRQQAAVAQLGQSALRRRGKGQLEALFAEAVELIASSGDFDFADVAELLPDDTLVLRAAHGWREGIVGQVHFPAGSGSLCAWALAADAPGVVEDIREETRFALHPVIAGQGIRSHVTVLIKSGGRAFGTLGGGARAPRRYSQHDVTFLQSVANLLASSVEGERAASQLQAQREELQALSRRLLNAQEAERRAVARELHDDFGQVLSALKLNLQRRERDVSDSIELVDGAIARMRDLVLDLRPPLLDELGLESSLRWYADREAARAGLELALRLEPLPERPALPIETSCFRVAQEALTNAVRHAQAKRLELALREEDGALCLEVRDDGRGFDPAEARARAARGESHGVLTMQERAALAGGELQIDSRPGAGTTVRLRVPLHPLAAARAASPPPPAGASR